MKPNLPLLLLLTAVTLVACSHPTAVPPQPVVATEPVPAPVVTPPPVVTTPPPPAPPVTPAATLPTKSLWDGAVAYAPFTLRGQTITSVETKQGMYLLRREGDDVYLEGMRGRFSSVILTPQAQPLFHLPHTVGQEWKVGDYSYRVKAVADTVTVTVTDKQGKAQDETWAPDQPVKGDLRPLPALGHPAPGVTALLVDTGGPAQAVLSTDGKELGRVTPVNTAREFLEWQPVGSQEFVWNSSLINGQDFMWTAYVYQDGAFRRVQWIAPGWDQPYVAVTLDQRDYRPLNAEFRKDGTIAYKGRDGKTVLYRWDGTAFRGEVQQ